MSEGPHAGSSLLTSAPGRWSKGTIRRCNDDGTFTIELDVKAMSFMPYWHGVTLPELAFDDAAAWGPVFARWRGAQGMGWAEAQRALAAIGIDVADAAMQAFWTERLELLGVEGGDGVVDEGRAYEIFRGAGFSSKQLTTRPAGDRFHTLYWNQTRMGGRDPADVGRAIGVDDALAALGLAEARQDAAAVAAIDGFAAEHGLNLPDELRILFGRTGGLEAIGACHPNSPEPRAPESWQLFDDARARGLPCDRAITFMDPHQGEHLWSVGFDAAPGGVARVFVAGEDLDNAVPVAPSLAFFVWDLAQTGKAWAAMRGAVAVLAVVVAVAVAVVSAARTVSDFCHA